MSLYIHTNAYYTQAYMGLHCYKNLFIIWQDKYEKSILFNSNKQYHFFIYSQTALVITAIKQLLDFKDHLIHSPLFKILLKMNIKRSKMVTFYLPTSDLLMQEWLYNKDLKSTQHLREITL